MRDKPGTRNAPARVVPAGTLAGALLFCVLLLLVTGAEAGFGAEAAGARITAFDPASGVRYPGQEASSSVRVKNTGPRKRTFWVGYSVRDGTGRWHDVPSHSFTLEPGQVSSPQSKDWQVPSDLLTTTGPYGVRMSVWRTRPENGGATRLASVQKAAAFRVRNFEDDFDSLDPARWSAVSQSLGRGTLNPANVATGDGYLSLKLPARTLDGAAIRSQNLYQYGAYEARIKTPDAPSSITGFFLYDTPDYEKEIDVEIYNDGTHRVMFSTYAPHHAADGTLLKEPTNTVTKTLPFDPATGFHDYAFAFYPDSVSFSVDGNRMQSWSSALPQTPMKLWMNVWYPTWLQGNRQAEDRYVYVDRIEH